MVDTLTIIPARGGSLGLPRKNILPLRGKPLIAHTIEQAKTARLSGPVVVSTNDDEIADISRKYGAFVVRRPLSLSGPNSPSEEALLHVLDYGGWEYDPEIIVMLQCTSPIRSPIEIDKAVEMVGSGYYDSVVSVVRLHQFVWRRGSDNVGWSVNYDPVSGMRPMRQSIEDFIENGSIYTVRTEILRKTHKRLGGKIGLLEMPYWSRFEIDCREDIELIEWIMDSDA